MFLLLVSGWCATYWANPPSSVKVNVSLIRRSHTFLALPDIPFRPETLVVGDGIITLPGVWIVLIFLSLGSMGLVVFGFGSVVVVLCRCLL
jgi:hypothetical protein